MATINARQIASTLYDALLDSAVAQLRQAEKKLSNTAASGEALQAEVAAALGKDATPQVHNFVLGLAKEGLLAELGAIADALASLSTASASAALDAEVTSAVALSDEQRGSITKDLRARYGEGLAVSFTVDESLIGGLVIRVGDQVLDNSLRARLGALQRSMLAS